MTAEYKQTTLWKTAFDARLRNKNQRTARDDLLSALRKLEDRVVPLLAKIDASCHELTIHDITHVHQLWSVASEICGPDYPLNPLEGFVLGAAFLNSRFGPYGRCLSAGVDWASADQLLPRPCRSADAVARKWHAG